MKYLLLFAALTLVACGDDDGKDGKTIEVSGYIALKAPCVSPDGSRVAMTAGKDFDEFHLITTNLDGGSLKVLRTTGIDFFSSCDWSPDGDMVYFMGDAGEGEDEVSGILRMPDDESGEPELVIDAFVPYAFDISPDGSTIAWSTNGGTSVLRAPLASIPVDRADQVSTDLEGSEPKFSPDGSQLVYMRGESYYFGDTSTWTETGEGPDGADYLANAAWVNDDKLLYLGHDEIQTWTANGTNSVREAFAGTDLDYNAATGQYVYGVNGGSSIFVYGL